MALPEHAQCVPHHLPDLWRNPWVRRPEAESQPTRRGAETSTVLEETIDANYEPTKKDEIDEYAKWLGMDPVVDQHLFWVAREGLKAP